MVRTTASPRTPQWARGLFAGLAGGVAWILGMLVFFSPAQKILASPSLQSPKFLAAFTADPLPRIDASPWFLPAAVLSIGVLWGWVYVWIASAWSGAWWKRGLRFGITAWVLMAPWFEFYLPWNVMHEPAPLVALELVCWAGVILSVGLTIAGIEAALARRPSSAQ